jgi:hypothetical protein
MYNLLAALSSAKIDYVLDIEELRRIKRQLAEGRHGQD